MNKTQVTAFVALLFFTSLPRAVQGDAERLLARAPQGDLELVLKSGDSKEYGALVIRNAKTGETQPTDSGQGYGYLDDEDQGAVWKPSGDAFAVTLRGTKTTRHTDVYVRKSGSWQKLEFPAFVENILGRQGAIETGKPVFIDFGGFRGDHQLVLHCHVVPEWHQPQGQVTLPEWKPTAHVHWEVVLDYRPGGTWCRIHSILPRVLLEDEEK